MKRTFVAIVVVGAVLSFARAQTQEGWVVSGTVTNDSGPVKGAHIVVNGASPFPWFTTDGQGRYSVKGVVPGLYTITVNKEDNRSLPKPRTLTLARGMRLKVDLRIPRGGVISGRVLDRDKKPVSGVIVEARSKASSEGRLRFSPQGGDVTNDLGEYRIPHLPDGAYVVSVVQRNSLPVRKRSPGSTATPKPAYPPVTFYPGTRSPDAAGVFEMRSGDERPGVDIVLQKEATRCVSFKVGGGYGDARTGASLTERLGATARAFGGGSVAASGSYEICGVTPGEYRLGIGSSVSIPSPSGSGLRFQPLGYQFAVVVVDKENVDLGSLEPLAREDIRGTVKVKDAKAGDSLPAGIRVDNVPWELDFLYVQMQPGQVQPDGTFVLRGALAGEYGIQVRYLPAGYYFIGASQQGTSVSDTRGLWPGNGDVQITLGADGSTVSGRVLAADGAAIPDASVLLVPKQPGPHLVSQSDQTGAYQFAAGVRPGEYRLVAASDLLAWQRQDEATAARLAADGLKLELGPRESRTVDLKIQSAR
jgi:hypothetical protein